MKKIKIGILASGGGTNAQAIIDASQDGILAGYVEVVVIISNNSKAGVLDRAGKHGIPCFHISERRYGKNTELMFMMTLRQCEVDIIVLAGYMKKMTPGIVDMFSGKIINIHPSLLPKHGGEGMYGLKVHESVLKAKDTLTGVTVHVVDNAYDTGRILDQVSIPVPEGIIAEDLQKLVLIYEHKILPEVLLHIAEGKIDLHF